MVMKFGLISLVCVVPMMASATPWPSGTEVLRQSLQQGGFWLAEVPASSTLTLGGVPLALVPAANPARAYVVVGFERFEQPERWLKMCAPHRACTSHKLKIAARTYDTQNVLGTPKATLKPDAAAQVRIAADNAAIAKARAAVMAHRSHSTAFARGFVRPSVGRVSGVYGSRRLFEGEERTWHKGTDFAAPTGTPVVAPAAGVVRLARDTFMSGQLIMLDHGGGISTLYAHLSAMQVKVGQRVKMAEQIGKIGTTGRSSGPHLHWGMYWGAVPIDPTLWLAPPLASAP